MNVLMILMYVVNMRPIYSLPLFFVSFIQIAMRSKTIGQSRNIKLGLKSLKVKELVVMGCLVLISCLFVLNQAWMGLNFSENGGYEAVAPLVSLVTCLGVRVLNGKWSFSHHEIKKSLMILFLIFGFDLAMRVISLPGIQLDYLMTEFKYGGLFPTSNVAGYLACTCLVLSKQVRIRFFPILWFIVILLTASRTSIAAGLFCIVALDRFGKVRGPIVMVSGLAIAAAFVYLTNINWSFESKIIIIERFIEVLQSGSLYEIIFGTVGGRLQVWQKLDVSAEGTLLSPHNPFVKITLYYGLIGMSCMVGFLLAGNRAIAIVYLLHCASGIVPFLSITQFTAASKKEGNE